jgi:plastocyanin
METSAQGLATLLPEKTNEVVLMRTRSLLLLLLVGGAASCGRYGSSPAGPSGQPIAAGPHVVLVPSGTAASGQGPGYSPTPLTVPAGTTVTWGNNDGFQHTTVADGGAWNVTLDPGKTGSVTLSTPGTYAYHCSIHAFMKGTIVVQ